MVHHCVKLEVCDEVVLPPLHPDPSVAVVIPPASVKPPARHNNNTAARHDGNCPIIPMSQAGFFPVLSVMSRQQMNSDMQTWQIRLQATVRR